MPNVYHAVLLDLDGTLTPVASFWQHLHEKLSIWNGDAEKYQNQFHSGDIDYETFCRLDAERWRGRPVAEFQKIADQVPLRPGAVEFVEFLRRRGKKVGMISTGLTLLAERIHYQLELDFTIANRLEIEAKKLTGEVKINVEHGGKDEAVELFCNQFGISPRNVIAIGDSEGDISMFRAVGYSIAFNAGESAVKREAQAVCDGDNLLALIPHLPGESGSPLDSGIH